LYFSLGIVFCTQSLENAMTYIVPDPSKPYPVLSLLTFHFESGTCDFKNGLCAFDREMTLLGVADTPVDLAVAFLTFISDGKAPYTLDEAEKVVEVITAIYQRSS
ncbi:MAG TPA: hypothetical protein VMV38_00865, partial [Candidatus Paceibacterota bacterium]|nr:hypothetical protein [Candidatus Paceibacterota bacterium]